MSADADGDSQMAAAVDESENIQASIAQAAQSSEPHSPPQSQQRNLHASSLSAGGPNANGKRPINTISNGHDEEQDVDVQELIAAASQNKAPTEEFPPRTHQPSGYTWTRAEDEPGASWLSKKAMDEYHRAVESVVHQDCMIRGRYGDPFEAVDREQAIHNSLNQQ